MNRKKIGSLALATVICLSSSLAAFADSGSSTLPQDDPMAKYIYSTFAPKTQTSFKQFGSRYVNKVSDIRQSGNDLMLWGTDLSVGGGLITTLAKKYTLPGKFAVGAGGAMYFYGRYVTERVKNLQDNTVYVQEVYFKWTNPQQFEYEIMVKSWFEYQGTRISDIDTSYKTGDLY